MSKISITLLIQQSRTMCTANNHSTNNWKLYNRYKQTQIKTS